MIDKAALALVQRAEARCLLYHSEPNWFVYQFCVVKGRFDGIHFGRFWRNSSDQINPDGDSPALVEQRVAYTTLPYPPMRQA